MIESEDDEPPPTKKIRPNEQTVSGGTGRLKKGSGSSSVARTNQIPTNSENWVDSDEYDSGPETVRTKADDAFIDSDDEDKELLNDYEDEQRFDDERPAARSRTERREVIEDSNPLSQTLMTMKKKKAAEWSEEKKAELTQELLAQMDRASLEDDELYAKGQSAVVKLKSLEHVKNMIGIRLLQPTLLEYDLLSVLRRWIEPKDKITLTGLTVRTSVYEMLRKLPCEVVHLKRSGIGKTVMALLKHSGEIASNKQLLNEIVEKWNRLVFNKSSDMRHRVHRMAEAPIAVKRDDNSSGKNRVSSSIKEERGFHDILEAQGQKKSGDGFDRVRVPFSTGFMFSVQPSSKVDKKAVQTALRESVKGTKDVLLKNMRDMSGSGRKQQFRAVGVSLTGKNKG